MKCDPDSREKETPPQITADGCEIDFAPLETDTKLVQGNHQHPGFLNAGAQWISQPSTVAFV